MHSFGRNLAQCYGDLNDASAAQDPISVQIQERCVGDCRYYFRSLFELPCAPDRQIIFKASMFAMVDFTCDPWTDYDACKVVIQDLGPRQLGFFGCHLPAEGVPLLPLQKHNIVIIDVESAPVGTPTFPDNKV